MISSDCFSICNARMFEVARLGLKMATHADSTFWDIVIKLLDTG